MGFLGNIFGGSESSSMESFYERYFEDETREDSSRFLGHQEFHVTNEDMKEGIENIDSYAETKDIPVSKLASYCFNNLLRKGLDNLITADHEIYGHSSDIYGRYAEKGDDGLVKKAEHEYAKPMNKLKAAELIASEYAVGGDKVEIAERNLKRIKERQQEFEEIINSMNGQHARKAFEKLISTMENEREQINEERNQIKS